MSSPGNGISTGSINDNGGEGNYSVNSKIMIVAIVVLFGVVFFILGLHIYAKWFWRNGGGLLHYGGPVVSWRRRRRLEFAVTSQTRARQVGLDDKVKDSLPTFVFNPEKASQDGFMECAVCLEQFRDGEKGRLLPKCNHSFHIDCIDMWFQSNSTCPLCRCRVAPDPPPSPPVPEPSSLPLSEPLSLQREDPHSLQMLPAVYQGPDGNYYFSSEDLEAPSRPILNYRDDLEVVQAVVDSMLVHRVPATTAAAGATTGEEQLSASQRMYSSVEMSAPKVAPAVQYPSNVLFFGNQSQVNVGYGAAREENVTRQISAAGIHAPNCSVIEIPRLAANGAQMGAVVAAGNESLRLSDSTAAGGSKSPVVRLVSSSFKRLMSIRKGGAAVSPGPEPSSACVECDCKQGTAGAASTAPGVPMSVSVSVSVAPVAPRQSS